MAAPAIAGSAPPETVRMSMFSSVIAAPGNNTTFRLNVA